MKKFLILLLLFPLISSCTAVRPEVAHRVSVQFTDSSEREYELLAVRDSSLIVGSPLLPPNEIGAAEVIPFSHVVSVYRRGVLNDGSTIWGILLGAGAGALVGSIPHNPGNHGDLFAITIPAGILIGAIMLGPKIIDRQYVLSHPQDHVILQQFARFPGHEPPELQKIK
jgi:hypothetical protein